MYVIHMSFAKFPDGFHRIPFAAIALCCLVVPCRLTVGQAVVIEHDGVGDIGHGIGPFG